MCLRPRVRSWDIPVPKIDSAFDNLFVPSRPSHQALRNNFANCSSVPYFSRNFGKLRPF
ncbi:hypothetical protein [Thiolapillus sp.]|uniref:hypothetical protein n=1 Tax=Thiolapillus sp. TaxID=2017437 RepID=UPI0025EAF398|nr:hypothetical protein [Thiolapillus sp.]